MRPPRGRPMSTNKIRFHCALIVLNLLLGAIGWHADAHAATPPPWPVIPAAIPSDAALEARISSLLAGMTLEQKVAQMVQPDIRSVTPDDVRRYRLGSILNGGGAFPANRKYSTLAD